MNVRQLIALLVAVGAGAAAFFLMFNNSSTTPVEAAAPVEPDLVNVLIASRDLQRGERMERSALRWAKFPREAVITAFVTDTDGDVREEWEGALVRSLIVEGEPILPAKLVRGVDRGFMSALLEPGQRAVSIRVTPESSAGGFILPGDRVDVVLTYEAETNSGSSVRTSTIMSNVAVLAVDQQYEEETETIIADTITLAVSAQDAERLLRAKAIGDVSLSLRSLASEATTVAAKPTGVRVMRFGITAQ
ncbi:MAG: Flp pilus assembly protein CpaB [Pseudomonadota bacterium]